MADSARSFTRAELAARRLRGDVLLAIDHVVYDVTRFLDEHPGGAPVLLQNSGGDASACFHAVGHSDTALALRGTFAVGEMAPDERWPPAPFEAPPAEPDEPLTLQAVVSVWGAPLLLAALAVLVYAYLFP